MALLAWFRGAPPRWFKRLALAGRRRLLRLADGLVPPQVVLLEQATGASATQLLAALVRLGIPERLAARPQTAVELAAAMGLHAEPLHRLLRAAASRGLFGLDRRSGAFAATRLSQALRPGSFSAMGDFARYWATPANLAAWAEVEQLLRDGQSPFERQHQQTQWAYFAAHPEEEALFAGAMTSLTQLDARAIALAYPFARLETVCDVGGGRGTLLSEVLLAHPHLRGAVVDGPGVLTLAEAYLAAQGLAGRGQALAGDIFGEVPPGHGAYLLKDVLHDWDDGRALEILKRVRAASAPGGRLLICEVLVEPNEAVAPGALLDLAMLVLTTGRQRSRGELAALCGAAGFRLSKIWPTGHPIAVVEAFAE